MEEQKRRDSVITEPTVLIEIGVKVPPRGMRGAELQEGFVRSERARKEFMDGLKQ